MWKFKIEILLCLMICASTALYAQKSTVRATVQPSNILIGEQAIISLEVISPKGRNIVFPVYQDTIVRGIEVLAMLAPDTTMTEVMTINQRYIITSFDSTLYHIPYMPILDGIDTLKSNNFGFKVSSPTLSDSTLAYLEKLKKQEVDSIDFGKLEIKDIKDIQDPPLVWTDYLQYALIPLLILVAIILITLIVILILNKRRKGYFFTPKIVLPPHIVALQGLDKLKVKNLSQQGMEKEYYTQLTDILRLYIHKRFGIDAPEMTSEEIINAVNKELETSTSKEDLGRLLQLADLVKFAKYSPLIDESDLSLANAYLFVNQTKEVEVELAEDKTKSAHPLTKKKANTSKQKKQ